MMYQAAVPEVEGLTGKHAIYLVADGPEVKAPERPRWGAPRGPQRPQGLFDLHGIGFTKTDAKPVTMAPKVTITANGKPLNIPTTPIYFTNQNGYAECNRYQVYGKLDPGVKLEATSDAPDGVKFEISPVVEGRATVKATFKGKTKIFLIN